MKTEKDLLNDAKQAIEIGLKRLRKAEESLAELQKLAELKATSEPKQTGWVPKEGDHILLLAQCGTICEKRYSVEMDATWPHILAQGRLAPNTPEGRSWLEAQRDRAASQWRSDNEEFEDGEVTYYFSCLLRRVVNIVYSPAHRHPYPLHKAAESAETDRGWATRLLEGRGW
jgi:hypothetical protein